MSPRPPTLIFAGGGTGGHLFPGIAVADEIRRRRPDAAITFVGTKGKIEARVVPARGYPFVTIWITGFPRRLSLETVLFPFRIVVALVQSLVLIRRRSPDAVVGTGGYVCGPVVYAAQILGIPTLVQEQNSMPGVTTRLLAPRATEVHITFESSRRHLKRQDNIHVSGNPTRGVLGTVSRSDAAGFFGLDPARRTLLVFGGSLGATSINRALLPAAPGFAAEGIQIVWQTGEQDFDLVRTTMDKEGDNVRVYRFIDSMEYAYAVCDLVVCRSGAGAVAELTRVGLASVLVPYPFAAADHQTENAKVMAGAGAAMLVPDREAPALLPPAIRELLRDPERRKSMADAARRLGKPLATSALAEAVLRVARR